MISVDSTLLLQSALWIKFNEPASSGIVVCFMAHHRANHVNYASDVDSTNQALAIKQQCSIRDSAC
jgi:hypothetical protein